MGRNRSRSRRRNVGTDPLFDVFFSREEEPRSIFCAFLPATQLNASIADETFMMNCLNSNAESSEVERDLDASSDEDLGFAMDVVGDESQRVKANPRHELARLNRKRFALSDREVEVATDGWLVEGRCQKVDKGYQRLTSAPSPDDVRPEPILRIALDRCCERWASAKNWAQIDSQLRSIRQDITVQQLRGPFAAHAYETCARLALEASDISQFLQCQGKVAQLQGSRSDDARREFACYRILYLGLQGLEAELADNLRSLSAEDRRSAPVMFARRLLAAEGAGNRLRFFRGSRDASSPGQASALLAAMVGPSEATLLHSFCRALKPSGLRLSRVAAWLGRTEVDCRSVVETHGAIITDARVDAKLSEVGLSAAAKRSGRKQRKR